MSAPRKIGTCVLLALRLCSAGHATAAEAQATLDSATRRNVALATTAISLLSIVLAATIAVRVLTNRGVSTGALLIAAGIIYWRCSQASCC